MVKRNTCVHVGGSLVLLLSSMAWTTRAFLLSVPQHQTATIPFSVEAWQRKTTSAILRNRIHPPFTFLFSAQSGTPPRNISYFYNVLGVTRESTIQQIKTAYRRLAKQLHPDANPGSDTSAMFQDVNSAYEAVLEEARKKKQLLKERARYQEEQAAYYAAFHEEQFAYNAAVESATPPRSTTARRRRASIHQNYDPSSTTTTPSTASHAPHHTSNSPHRPHFQQNSWHHTPQHTTTSSRPRQVHVRPNFVSVPPTRGPKRRSSTPQKQQRKNNYSAGGRQRNTTPYQRNGSGPPGQFRKDPYMQQRRRYSPRVHVEHAGGGPGGGPARFHNQEYFRQELQRQEDTTSPYSQQ